MEYDINLENEIRVRISKELCNINATRSDENKKSSKSEKDPLVDDLFTPSDDDQMEFDKDKIQNEDQEKTNRINFTNSYQDIDLEEFESQKDEKLDIDEDSTESWNVNAFD